MRFPLSIILILMFIVDRGERAGAEKQVDPDPEAVTHLIKVLEQATLAGKVEINVNGHQWRFHDPFQEGVTIDYTSPPTVSENFSPETAVGNLAKWLLDQHNFWILIEAGTETTLPQMWEIFDTCESASISYSLMRVPTSKALRLSAFPKNIRPK